LRFTRCLSALFLLAVASCLPSGRLVAQPAPNALGVFEGQVDIGSVVPPGTLAFDAKTGTYTITSAGKNLWSTDDGFHFAWKRLSGDFALTADIDFPVKTGSHSAHRKAVLMFRQSLDADSSYADAALHGSGLTALQYRRSRGATTQGVEFETDAPRRIRLEKRGDTFTVFLSNQGEALHQVGETIKLHLDGPFYAGIGLSSHDEAVTEKAAFANFELKRLSSPVVAAKLALYSTLQAIEIAEASRRADVVFTGRGRFQAPNWSRDGSSLIFNQDGRLYRIPIKGGAPQPIDTGKATDCTGSHGLSPDGTLLAITCNMPDNPGRRIYIVPSGGGTPRVLTEHPDSYFHSWSPDGRTIAFTRPSHGSGNIYSISVSGGPERALTSGSGISDDPDYSADGKYIYFNSDHSGSMQIWRMHSDGTLPEQVTFDSFKNWTPHPSPDGRSVVFISYDPSVTTHAANKDIALRILSVGDDRIRTLVHVVGGDGSMNVPNWSPDSKRLAFVSYQFLPEEDTGSSE